MPSPKLTSAAAIFQILEFERDRRLYKLERDEIAARRDASTPSTECQRCVEPAISTEFITSPSVGSLERGSLSSLEDLPVDSFAPQILSPIDSKCLTPDDRSSYGPARHSRKKSDGCISYSKSPQRTDGYLSPLSEDSVGPLSDSFRLQSPKGYRLRTNTRMKRSDSVTSQPTLIKSDYDCDSMRGLARTGFVTFHEVITLTARVLKGAMPRPQVELLMFRWMTNQGYMSQLSLFDQTQFEDVFNRITSDVIKGLDWDLDGLLSQKDVYDSVHSLLGWKALFAKGAIKRAFTAALAECSIDGDDKISKLELQDLVRRLASQELKLETLFPHSGLVKLLLSYAR